MIRIQQLKMPLQHTKKEIEKKIRKRLKLKPEQEFTFYIRKQSIDARTRAEVCYVYTVDVAIAGEERLLHKINDKNIMSTKEKNYSFLAAGTKKLRHSPVIVGSGPAGLFCAYQLAKYGYQPIVLERGRKVFERQKDVQNFWQDGSLDLESNVQFGEGGAGTFSDGKLNTLVKDPLGRNRYVLETFVKCGADESILYVNKPHLGTDVLCKVVANLRNEIIHAGGTFLFETCMTDIFVESGQIAGCTITKAGNAKTLDTQKLVLAIGHSARDTFQMLSRRQIPMEAKAFAVGFRVEHPQQMINAIQYKGADMRFLPTASYKVTANFEGQRGVYSFCMCPGGYVVNASSENHRLAVNGMSYQKRDGKNANSAIIVSVNPADYPDASALGAVAFQRQLEEKAYRLANGKIPQQLYGDYAARKQSLSYGDFESQTKGACAFADLNELLPEILREPFLCGMERFARKIPGFNRYDAILSGIESRTSSPVRIPRNEMGESSIQGLYPCGEGAGYAGGIMSAAMDGMKIAEAIMAEYAPCRK